MLTRSQHNHLAPLGSFELIERADTGFDETAEIGPRHSAVIFLASASVNNTDPMRIKSDRGLDFEIDNTVWHFESSWLVSPVKHTASCATLNGGRA